MVFKGMVGRYIWWLAAALALQLVLFTVLYLLQVALLFCVLFTLTSGAMVFFTIIRLSKKYGQNGWMKQRCRSSIPKHIKGFYFS